MTYIAMKAQPCSDGNFCVAGVDGTAVTETTCDYGSYCKISSVNVGAMESVACESGTYQD